MKIENSMSLNRYNRIISIDLDIKTGASTTTQIENECKIAIFDILEDNYFAPIEKNIFKGPYSILLLMELRRQLFIDVFDSNKNLQGRITLVLGGLRNLIKEYFQICDYYYDAVKRLTPSQIEPIDMARRGIHNDGAEKLKNSLAQQVEINTTTSRRLFTLLCVLFTR